MIHICVYTERNICICVYAHTQRFWKFLSDVKIFKVFLSDTLSLYKPVCTSIFSQHKCTAIKYRDCTPIRDIKRWKRSQPSSPSAR